MSHPPEPEPAELVPVPEADGVWVRLPLRGTPRRFATTPFPNVAVIVKNCDHRNIHLISEVAALLCPLPEPGTVTPEDCYTDAREQAEAQRTQYADNLEAAALATEEDPLILALEQARAQKEEADRRIRLLFA